MKFVLQETHHEIEIWFGCGTNCTADTLRAVHQVQQLPIDGVLLAAPYYNRPSQAGLYEHFACIAAHSSVNVKMCIRDRSKNIQVSVLPVPMVRPQRQA